MRYLAVRGIFLVVLLASLVARYQTVRDRDEIIARYDPGAAIADVIRAHGLTVGDNPVAPPKILSWIVYFHQPGCDGTSFAMPFRLNVQAMPIMQRVAAHGYRYRIFYLDGSWETQDRLSLFAQWLKYAVFSLVGASRYIPTPTAMATAEPADCAAPRPIDWRLVWDRERQGRSIGERTAQRREPSAAAPLTP